VRYELVETFDEMAKVAEKKEENIKEVPRPTMQSMVKTIIFSIEPESWKHSKVNFCMEVAMEQMINQMNHFNLHILQPKANKSRNLKNNLSIVQCYKC